MSTHYDPEHPFEDDGVLRQRQSDEDRRSALAHAVSREVAAGGQVQSQTPHTATVVHVRPTNHILHLILSLVTFGVWLFVWPIVYIIHKAQENTTQISVDEFGHVRREKIR